MSDTTSPSPAAPAEPEKKKRRSMKEQWATIRSAWPDFMELTRPFRPMMAFGLFLVITNRAAGLVAPGATKYLIDEGLKDGKANLPVVYRIAMAVVAATTIQGISSYFLTQTLSKAAQRLIRDLRVKVQHHIMRLSLKYYDARKSGDLVSRVMNDVDGLRNLVGTGMVELLSGLLSSTAVFFILLHRNWLLTLVILFFLVIFLVITGRSFVVLRPLFRERSKLLGETSGRLSEAFGGIRVIKSYHTERREDEVFSTNVTTLLDRILRTIGIFSGLGLVSGILTGVVTSTVMVLGVREVARGAMTLGDLFSYWVFVAFLVGPVIQIARFGTELSEAFAGLERMKEVMNELREDATDEALRPLATVEGNVEFRDVVFGYDPARPVLHDITFSSKPGTVTALVGPSGAGKSTIINLLAHFHTPQAGAILVDGQDLREARLADYRAQLGAVLQDSFLFSGTAKENILYSRPDATDSEVREAARLSHCLEFIEGLPQGFETVIGERGVKLSGGQRQRLAIARAILARPRILILDEATSALDTESEAYIQEGLSVLMKGRTTFVIAHRLSTIRLADQILVMEGGRIVERGTHDALIAAQGRYYEMYTRQMGQVRM